MRKRILASLLVLCVVLTLLPITALAEEGELIVEPIAAWDVSAAENDHVTATLTQNNGDAETPAYTLTVSGTGEMENYVSMAKQPWSAYRASITELVLEDGITGIGNFAFRECSGVTGNLTIPSSVLRIGDSAFRSCTGLSGQLVIPDGVTDIGKNALQGCKFSGELVIPGSIKNIGSNAFYGCSFITKLTIEDGVTSIGVGAFTWCNGIEIIALPDSITSIGSSAFSACEKLTAIELPEGLTGIESEVFSDCKGLKKVVIPDSVTSIGAGAFLRSGLEGDLLLSDNITSIGNRAFEGGSRSGKIKIPTGVTKIGTNAFLNTYPSAFEYHGPDSDNYPNRVESIAHVDLSGSGVRSFIVQDYSERSLVTADFSNCKTLAELTIKHKWNLASLNLSGINPDAKIVLVGNIKNCTLTLDTWLLGNTIALEDEYGGSYISSNNDAVSVSNGVVTVNGLGTATLTSGANTINVSVNPAKLIVTANSQKITVYDELPSYTYTVEGLMPGDSLTQIPSLSCTADGNTAGKFDITLEGAQAGDNYEIEYVNGTLSVEPAPLIITAEDKTMVVGDELPEFTYTVEGLFLDDELVTPPTFACTGDGKTQGTFRIIPNGANAGGNYAVAYTSSTLTVNPVPPYSGYGKAQVSHNEGGTATAKSDGTVTITPDEDYQIEKVTVNGKAVAIPASHKLNGLRAGDKVVITFALLTEIKDPEVPLGGMPFVDVGAEDWFYSAVTYVYGKGLMKGTGDTVFEPYGGVTRATVWTVLYRAAGAPAVNADDSSWYAAARSWAVEKGISDGSDPEGLITREQLAAMLYRHAGSPAVSGMALGEFPDSLKVSDWAKDAMLWAVESAIVTGKDGGELKAQDGASRAEAATMLMRRFQAAEN